MRSEVCAVAERQERAASIEISVVVEPEPLWVEHIRRGDICALADPTMLSEVCAVTGRRGRPATTDSDEIVAEALEQAESQVPEMDVHSMDWNKALRLARYFLCITGLWPDTKPENKQSCKYRVHQLLSALGVAAIVLRLAWNVANVAMESTGLMTQTSLNLIMVLRFTFALHKFYILYYQKNVLFILLQNCFTKFEAPKFLHHQINIYKNKCYQQSKILKQFLIFIVLIIFPMMNFSPLVQNLSANEKEKNQHLPTPIWIPSIFETNSGLYVLAYTFQVVCFVPLESVIAGFSLLYIVVTMLARHMLDHLIDVLQQLQATHAPSGHVTEEALQRRVAATLRYAAQHHQRTIGFIAGVNSMYSYVLLTSVWTVLLLLCVLAFQITSEGLPDVLRATNLAQQFMLALCTFSIVSWNGSQMQKSGAEVRASFLHVAWWTWSSANQRTARVMAVRCKQELRLRVGPFYSLSLVTFTDLLGLSFSYFIFLHQMNKLQLSPPRN